MKVIVFLSAIGLLVLWLTIVYKRQRDEVMMEHEEGVDDESC